MANEVPASSLTQRWVDEFNESVLGIPRPEVRMLTPDEMALSLKQMREELDELEEAFREGSIAKVVDALIDLDYFHKGVLYKMGLSHIYNRLFFVVHLKNMEKVKGVKKGREGFKAADATKPEGWIPPDEELQLILAREIALQSGEI